MCSHISTLSNMQSVSFYHPEFFVNIISVKKDIQTATLQMYTTELIPRRRKKYLQEN